MEEPDQDEEFNRTQNPIRNEDILLNYIEEVQRPNEIWINAKTSAAIEFHLKHDEKKENLPLEQQIPEAFHEFWMFLMKKKPTDFLNPIHGTTKSN